MSRRVSTGINGLDEVLKGGFPEGTVVIVEGAPGTGKTTFGLQFLYEGAVHKQENGIYITFEELPDQLYQNALAFGFDIRQLEKMNRLRIICISPQLLLQEMSKPGGLFEKMIEEIDCRRLVIDSISLFRYAAAAEEEVRRYLYRMRNILRKWKITSLLIREDAVDQTGITSFENYVVDGVIRLALKPFMDKYRKRTLEVLKMRGTSITEGEHIFRFMNDGIHLAPLFKMVQDKVLSTDSTLLPTGIASLDALLGGGVSQGSVFILDTNSKANYLYLLNPMLYERLRRKERAISILSGMNHFASISRLAAAYGVDLKQELMEGRLLFIDHYDRKPPAGLEHAFICVQDLDHDAFRAVIRDKFYSMLREDPQGRLFFHLDLSTLFTFRGVEFMQKFFSEEVAEARQAGVTMLALSNFEELPERISSFLERVGDGVVRNWVDGNYQYIQITKSPNGQMSPPYLIESIPEQPYIRLV